MIHPLTDREFQQLGRGGRILGRGALQSTVTLTNVQTTLALPAVTLVIPTNISITIIQVYAAISWRKQVDSSSADNAINGATQQIRVRSDAPGTFVNAITIPDNSLATGADATEGGIMVLGEVDISGEVDESDTYEFQWLNAQVDGANLTLHDFQTYLIVEYT